MSRHLDDFAISELCDGRAVAAPAHLADCARCRSQLDAFRLIRAEAALERLRTHEAPDPWPQIAALTIHRAAVRRVIVRSLRRPMLFWLLVSFGLGVAATESVRALSARAAAAAAAVPRGDVRDLKALRKIAPSRQP